MQGMIIAILLINNGYALIYDCKATRCWKILNPPKGMMIRASDGAKTVDLREINLEILIRLYDFDILFVVIGILIVFKLLWS